MYCFALFNLSQKMAGGRDGRISGSRSVAGIYESGS